MTVRDKIHETNEYQQIAGEAQEVAERTRRADSPREAVSPVISLEKTDVQFWVQIGQLVLLVLIWRELSGGAV